MFFLNSFYKIKKLKHKRIRNEFLKKKPMFVTISIYSDSLRYPTKVNHTLDFNRKIFTLNYCNNFVNFYKYIMFNVKKIK